MKKIAIIPARSGSKGLIDKNIRKLNDKPLMNYTIEAAQLANKFEKVIVSTDSEHYAEIARTAGAEVLMRGKRLSDDKATSFMVIEDILNRISITDLDYFTLLQPTSPLRTSTHIIEALDLYESRFDQFDFLVSMKRAEFSSILVKPIEDDLSLKYFDTDFSNYRRQSYKEYSPNGAIFCGKPKEYLKQKHFFGRRSVAYIMNDKDSIDIDTDIDFLLAEAVMKEKI